VDIGIIGVLTERTAATTIIANIAGVKIAPLADAIVREAGVLREAGASLVVVVAHAGSRCEEFEDPSDLSSCEMTGEIMRVANDIPAGLVDHIVAGHVHRGMAHIVNDIVITSSYSKTRAFGRVDFTFDRDSGAIINRHIYPPHGNCAKVPDDLGRCTSDSDPTSEQATYEGHPVVPMESVAAIAERARERVAQRQAQDVGVFLETPITLDGRFNSALGNLMTDAVREYTGADIAIHNIVGGIRADLPAGELTFGSVFRMFPFDNRIAILDLSGKDVRKIIEVQARNPGRRSGFSGMRVFVECNAGEIDIRMQALDGRDIQDTEILSVATNDFLLLGGDGIFTPAAPEQGFDIPYGTPLVRDVLVNWFAARGGRMRADQFLQADQLRWNLPDAFSGDCSVSGS
jgi:5'-nucleotidase